MLNWVIPALLFLIHISSANAQGSRVQIWEDILSPSKIAVYLYPAEGSTLNDLKAAMLKNGPVSVQGSRFYAQAKWLISWYWKKENGIIDFTKTDIIADFQMTIPHYTGSTELLPLWQKFYEASVKHELQHLQHGNQAALNIINLTRLNLSEKNYSKESMVMKIDKIISEARNNDTYYDRTTAHGIKEGVNL